MELKKIEITLEEFLKNRQEEYPLTEELAVNAARLLFKVNCLIQELPEAIRPKDCTSGYRPGHYNTAAGGAKKSAHLTCEAIDLADAGNKVDDYLTAHPELLVKYDLYREDPAKTLGWSHLQTRKTMLRTFKI